MINARRWALGVAAVATVATATACAGTESSGMAEGSAAAPFSTAGQGSSSPAATQMLLAAASTALTAPKVAVRGDQFVFVESLVARAGTSVEGGKATTTVVPARRQVWLSASGERPGLLRERPASGGAWDSTPLDGPNATPAYRADVPTDVDAALKFLYANSHGGNPADQQAFITVGDLIRESYLKAESLSAVFAATAKIPGVTLVDDVSDAAGRRGVAVSRTHDGIRHELIFDKTTSAFLGERQIVVKDLPHLANGTVLDSTAVLRTAIVERPGQTP